MGGTEQNRPVVWNCTRPKSTPSTAPSGVVVDIPLSKGRVFQCRAAGPCCSSGSWISKCNLPSWFLYYWDFLSALGRVGSCFITPLTNLHYNSLTAGTVDSWGWPLLVGKRLCIYLFYFLLLTPVPNSDPNCLYALCAEVLIWWSKTAKVAELLLRWYTTHEEIGQADRIAEGKWDGKKMGYTGKLDYRAHEIGGLYLFKRWVLNIGKYY